ncbi:MAG: hypothetical protein KGQ58_09040 [Proteobacteria bacterium]|nr:hypothetical protein [Pseudomonadota bacterium]
MFFSKKDIEKMFQGEGEKSVEKSLSCMVSDGLLVRVCKGEYLNPMASSKSSRIPEDIALALRPGSYSCASLESMFSEYGVFISQIPMIRHTVRMTRAGGTYETPYALIGFTYTHTQRNPATGIDCSVKGEEGRPMRIARKQTAVRDWLRVGRT